MYAKVFRSMWEGTLAGTGETWAVFVFLLAHCDREGFVDMHPRVIASLTGFAEDRVRSALNDLEAPDLASRTDAQHGVRLERIDEHREWGWQIVNYLKYRTMVDAEMVRAQTRERVRNHRERKRAVTPSNGTKRHGEGDAEGEVEETEEPTLSVADAPALPGFNRFWTAYACQRRRKKPAALAEWRRQRCESVTDAVLAGLDRYKLSEQWRDGFMPEPARWLKGRCWEDDAPAVNGDAPGFDAHSGWGD